MRGKKTNKSYTKEFKKEAVTVITEQRCSVPRAVKSLGIASIIMSDALSNNRLSKAQKALSHCAMYMAEGNSPMSLSLFLVNAYSGEVKFMLELYQKIWVLDDQIKEKAWVVRNVLKIPSGAITCDVSNS